MTGEILPVGQTKELSFEKISGFSINLKAWYCNMTQSVYSNYDDDSRVVVAAAAAAHGHY